jgi:hypothetical protein
VAPSVGYVLWPWLGESDFGTADKKPDYQRMFLVPAATGALAALILAPFLDPPKKATIDTDVETGEASP